ncbi:MAG: Crp/Fnr family transcriptional regulator [SAR324 cluster bacterium]|nr:Crp/Fnr family transcriptional regulator [SAR324 cluster bacterium]
MQTKPSSAIPPKLLYNFQTLKNFPPHVLDEMNDLIELKMVERREIIFNQGDLPDYLFGIIQGRVKIVHNTVSGKNILFAIHETGQIIAEAPAIGGFAYPATAIAMTSSVIFRMEHQKFTDILMKYPELSLELLKCLGKRVVYFADKMSQMAVLTVHQRIAQVLLEFVQQYGVAEGSCVHLELSLTRQELADIVGTSIETTIRALSLFKKQKIVNFDHQHIIIEDCKLLEQILVSGGGTCPLKSREPCLEAV